MKGKPGVKYRPRRSYLYVGLIFFILIISLQGLLWLFWQTVLEPRLMKDATSQANVLAHSQAVKLAETIKNSSNSQLQQSLDEAINEILLLTDPETNASLFLGCELELDYDVVSAPHQSLDRVHGEPDHPDCFVSQVALFSTETDELLGIARFHVSGSFYKRLSEDVQGTLFMQSTIVTLLLGVVCIVVMLFIREINRSTQQAEAANRAKSIFLANMSHELRTPLNSIIGFSDLMSRDPQFLPKYRKNLSIINRSGAYLLELVNDVLELSKIEASQSILTKSSFDLYETLEKVLEMIRPRLDGKKLHFTYEKTDDVPRNIEADERKLRQILLNLLGNAIKFTEEGGVSLRVKLQDGGQLEKNGLLTLHFEVEDSGPGIPPEEREHLFEAFTQTRSGYDKKEGTGLGLAISRQFVHQLGGKIWVNSAVDRGTAFGFTISATKALSSDLKKHLPARRVVGISPSGQITRARKSRILIVDDNADNRELLEMLIAPVGLSVKTAVNGKEAVTINQEWCPDLIWMDMRMPEMNGYEATRTIRKTNPGQPEMQPKIIALTATAFEEDREKVLAEGCDDFVRKPFREAEIFTKMHEHLGMDFIYEDIEETSYQHDDIKELSAEAMQSEIMQLPKEFITELRSAIELSDMELMDQLIDAIDSDHERIASELKGLVDSFQYDRILMALGTVDRASADNPGEKK